MPEKQTIPVQILGQEYRVRSDGNAEAVRRAAAVVDETMARVRERTGTVDTLHVAVLAALNIANHLISLRDGAGAAEDGLDPEELSSLVQLVESTLTSGEPAH